MDLETIKMLVGLGVGGAIGGVSMYLWQQFRKEHREDLENLRDELHDSLVNLPGQLQAIHSRLGSLDADSVPPPVQSRRRRKGDALPRIQTSPVGWPVKPKEEP